MSDFRFFNEICEVINGNISVDSFCDKFNAFCEANPNTEARWSKELDKEPLNSILKNMMINSGFKIVEV